MNLKLLAATAAALCAFQAPAMAATVVVPNAQTNTPGTATQFGIFGNSNSTGYAFQVQYAASQFAGVPVGSTITSIGFRLSETSLPPASAANFSNFSVTLGGSLNAIGSLNNVYALNQNPLNTTTVRSGAFTLPLGALTQTAGANPFFMIDFTTPYTYTGGDLLVTLMSTYAAGATVPFVGVDAVAVGGITDTRASRNDTGANYQTVGSNQSFNAPVIAFTYGNAVAGVPEPATWAMLLVGFGLVGARLRRRTPVRVRYAA